MVKLLIMILMVTVYAIKMKSPVVWIILRAITMQMQRIMTIVASSGIVLVVLILPLAITFQMLPLMTGPAYFPVVWIQMPAIFNKMLDVMTTLVHIGLCRLTSLQL